MASAFPPRYTQAMMAGQGLAGLAVALAGLFTTLAGPDDNSCILDVDASTFSDYDSSVDASAGGYISPQLAGLTGSVLKGSCAAYTRDWSTLVYFGIAVMVLQGCILTFSVLERLPLTRFYTSAVSFDEEDGVDTRDGNDAGRESNNNGSRVVGSRAAVASSSSLGSSMYRRLVDTPLPRLSFKDKVLSDSVVFEKENEEGDGRFSVTINEDEDLATIAMASGLRLKLAPISRYAFAVFLVFTVTLSVFPGATSQIVSSHQCESGRSRFFAGDVFVMFSFVSFNSFDFLGRLAAGLAIALPNAWLPVASVSRVVFIPLLLACRSENSRFRNWFSSDFFPLSIMPLFAFTNGFVSSLSMIAGSQKGAWAGTAMVLFLNGGLLTGSVMSFLLLYVSSES